MSIEEKEAFVTAVWDYISKLDQGNETRQKLEQAMGRVRWEGQQQDSRSEARALMPAAEGPEGTGRGKMPPSALSLDEQLKEARQALERLGIVNGSVWKDEEKGIIAIDLLGLSGVTDKTLSLLVKAVEKLPNLQFLNLSGTGVTDLTPLSNLTNLQVVNLSETGVTDLAPLSNLTNLWLLNLSGTQIRDVAIIFQFIGAHPNGKALRVVNAHGETIKWEDVPENYRTGQPSALSLDEQLNEARQALERLGIDEDKAWKDEKQGSIGIGPFGLSGVTDKTLSLLVKAVEKLPNLQFLNLSGTGVTDLTPLSRLTNLQVVNLSGTGVTDLAPLFNLTNLWWVNLSGTQIRDVAIFQFIGAHPNGKALSVVNAHGETIKWEDVPKKYKEERKSLTPRRSEVRGVEGAAGVVNDLLDAGRSEEAHVNSGGVSVGYTARAVVDALRPPPGGGLTRAEVRQVYEVVTSDFDGFVDAIVEAWLNRTKDRGTVLEDDLGISQAAIDESDRLIDHLQALRATTSLPAGTITIGMRLSAQDNTSFLAQLFKVLQNSGEKAEVLAEAATVKKIPVTAANVTVRPVRPIDWQRGFRALRSSQKDVPVALDIQFMNEQMGGMFTGILLNWGESKPGRLVEDFGELLLAVTLVEMAKIFADPTHKAEIARLKANPQAKAEYLKAQLLQRLADLGYPQEMFASGANGYLTIKGTIAVAFLEMKVKEAMARAA